MPGWRPITSAPRLSGTKYVSTAFSRNESWFGANAAEERILPIRIAAVSEANKRLRVGNATKADYLMGEMFQLPIITVNGSWFRAGGGLGTVPFDSDGLAATEIDAVTTELRVSNKSAERVDSRLTE